MAGTMVESTAEKSDDQMVVKKVEMMAGHLDETMVGSLEGKRVGRKVYGKAAKLVVRMER